MAKLEQALYTLLTNDTAVAAFVGDRIFPVSMPKPDPSNPTGLPAVSYRRLPGEYIYTFDKFDEGSAYVNATVEFSAWSNNAKEAMDVGEALVLALSGYSGDVDGTLIGQSFTRLELDMYDGDTKLYRRAVEFRIGYEDDVHS
jgi:uncharacterized protein DUF3168